MPPTPPPAPDKFNWKEEDITLSASKWDLTFTNEDGVDQLVMTLSDLFQYFRQNGVKDDELSSAFEDLLKSGKVEDMPTNLFGELQVALLTSESESVTASEGNYYPKAFT